MPSAKLFGGELIAGQTGVYAWNNPPKEVAHSFTAEPYCPFDSFGLHSLLAQVEIVHVVHEQQFVKWLTPPEGQIAGTPLFRDRITITIKNTGASTAGFDLYMAWG